MYQILTGATGALGAHILYQLLQNPTVQHVVCLARGPYALARVHASLQTRGIDLTAANTTAAYQKLSVLETANLGAPFLGLGQEAYTNLQSKATLIMHAAWPVHFSLSTASFGPHLAGLHNLLALALSSPLVTTPRLLFASSISAAFNTACPTSVPEAPIPNLSVAARTGYARSKLVGERICEAAAAAGADVGVLRIGQIAGDREKGVWNDKEAVPIMVRSAVEVGALPLLNGEKGVCAWMPADVVAAACLEIAGRMGAGGSNGAVENGVNGHATVPKAHYYHITPSHAVSWNDVVLPRLQAAGLDFEAVAVDNWLSKVRTRGEQLTALKAEAQLPALKLASYYEQTYGGSGVGEGEGVTFDNTKACRDSPTLRTCPDVAKAGLIEKFLHAWLTEWKV